MLLIYTILIVPPRHSHQGVHRGAAEVLARREEARGCIRSGDV